MTLEHEQIMFEPDVGALLIANTSFATCFWDDKLKAWHTIDNHDNVRVGSIVLYIGTTPPMGKFDRRGAIVLDGGKVKTILACHWPSTRIGFDYWFTPCSTKNNP